MRAVVVDRHGGPEVLTIAERRDPRPGPTEVLVDVEAAGVNFIDTYHRSGYYPMTPPFVPGVEGVGVVREVGEQLASLVEPGDRVGWVMVSGSYAERLAVPYDRLVPIPAELDPQLAAASLLQGVTAHYLTHDTYPVRAGDTVLVHAAAGGVGSLAVQIARSLGARVIGTASEYNHAYLRGLGAEPVAYGEGLNDRVHAIAPQGVDAVLDLVGGDALKVSPGLLAEDGRLASAVDGAVLGLGGGYVFVRPDARDLQALTELAERGELRVDVAATFPLEQAADAQLLNREGHTRGKIIIAVA